MRDATLPSALFRLVRVQRMTIRGHFYFEIMPVVVHRQVRSAISAVHVFVALADGVRRANGHIPGIPDLLPVVKVVAHVRRRHLRDDIPSMRYAKRIRNLIEPFDVTSLDGRISTNEGTYSVVVRERKIEISDSGLPKRDETYVGEREYDLVDDRRGGERSNCSAERVSCHLEVVVALLYNADVYFRRLPTLGSWDTSDANRCSRHAFLHPTAR